MNVNFNTPITITLSSAKLFSEDLNSGVIEFLLLDQPVRLVVDKTSYTYASSIEVGDRVKLTTAFSSFGINSTGILQEIIIDSTNDMADVLFDQIFPSQIINPGIAEVANSGTISLLFRVPFNYLEKV